MVTLFKKKKSRSLPKTENRDRGIPVFENTSEVIRAESLLKSKGWKIRVMGSCFSASTIALAVSQAVGGL